MYIFRDIHKLEEQQMKFLLRLWKKGYKQEMKTGFNQVLIKGLRKDVKYQLYYVLESHVGGRTSDVLGPIEVSGKVQEDPNLSKEYRIESVEESPKNTITVVLNKAPQERLTLQNFSFICPTGSDITIDNARLEVSEDGKRYKNYHSGKLWA